MLSAAPFTCQHTWPTFPVHTFTHACPSQWAGLEWCFKGLSHTHTHTHTRQFWRWNLVSSAVDTINPLVILADDHPRPLSATTSPHTPRTSLSSERSRYISSILQRIAWTKIGYKLFFSYIGWKHLKNKVSDLIRTKQAVSWWALNIHSYQENFLTEADRHHTTEDFSRKFH